MPLLDLVILAVIQGITEFLPISSSGHLALWPLLTGRPDQGVTLDLGVHLGTLVAVCLYFRRDLAGLFTGAGHLLGGRIATREARLALMLAWATVPAVALGLALTLTGTTAMLRDVAVIGWATLIGALLIWLADRFGAQTRRGGDWSWGDATLMGLAQALALIPGTSRSGICMAAGRALGFERTEGARLALLMAIPVTLAATAVGAAEIVAEGDVRLGRDFLAAAVLACIAALIALRVMMGMFRAAWTMTPFVLYRLALGVVLLCISYL